MYHFGTTFGFHLAPRAVFLFLPVFSCVLRTAGEVTVSSLEFVVFVGQAVFRLFLSFLVSVVSVGCVGSVVSAGSVGSVGFLAFFESVGCVV